jgi:hypothetical protein
MPLIHERIPGPGKSVYRHVAVKLIPTFAHSLPPLHNLQKR